jgi:transposase
MLIKPHNVPHTAAALSELADSLERLGGEVRVVLEHTGKYWLPIANVLREAGLFVSSVNPKLIKDSQTGSLTGKRSKRKTSLLSSRELLQAITSPANTTRVV